jgi:hypothetical protein
MRIRRLTGYGRMEEGMRKGDVCINQAHIKSKSVVDIVEDPETMKTNFELCVSDLEMNNFASVLTDKTWRRSRFTIKIKPELRRATN